MGQMQGPGHQAPHHSRGDVPACIPTAEDLGCGMVADTAGSLLRKRPEGVLQKPLAEVASVPGEGYTCPGSLHSWCLSLLICDP